MNNFKTLARVTIKYNDKLKNYPILVNSTTGFFIAALGDYGCQKYFESLCNSSSKDFEWDWARTFSMGMIRASLIVPFIHQWYPLLQKLAPRKNLVDVVKRVTLDQLIGSPIVIAIVFTSKSIINGRYVATKIYMTLNKFILTLL